MKTVRGCAVLLGSAILAFALAPADAQLPAPITVPCGELPFDSFPPNQLLRSENRDGSVVSMLQSSKIGTWGEFFIRVDRAGTYRLSIDSRNGPDEAVFQLIVDGDPVGQPVDGYSARRATSATTPIGDVTFQRAETHSFRFLVTGKNPSSGGSLLSLEKIALTPTEGFTLLAPNGSCAEGPDVLLRWNAWSPAKRYRVETDGQASATVDAPATTYQASALAPGAHRWRVVAINSAGEEKPSNVFSFVVGPPPPYPYREFTDSFSAGNPNNWSLESMTLTKDGAAGFLKAAGPGTATLKDVRLDKTEGEMVTHVTLGAPDAAAGVGFQSDDGTRIYAVVDLKRRQLRLERRVTGPVRYSIFEVTPKPYQVPGWLERTEGDDTIWEIAAKPIQVRPGASCELRLAYSRRSACIMATLVSADGSPTVTLRDLTDLRTPDHPLLIALAGSASFADASLHRLNKAVYKWDPDSTRIVLRPGPPGSWDERGAFNPAIIVRDGLWQIIYRGNSKPAPPNGPPSSELGLATSTDGVHWTKHPANPVIRKEDPKDSKEDPDLIWPEGSDQVYLEYVSFHAPATLPAPPSGGGQPREWGHGEVMCASSDFVHWSVPWGVNLGKTFGKMGGIIDAQAELNPAGIQRGDVAYRYVTMIEEGRIDLSSDLHEWIKAGTADLKGSPNHWCSSHECSGDIFVDADKNIRFESQIGVKPESGRGGDISGNRLCTIGEGVLSGSDPTKVLWRSDLPWLTDWYGDAPTDAPEDFTATNGSVFPGQTIIKDGWLWHYSGGNNHCTLLTRCWYGPLFECRDLQAETDAAGQCSARVVVRNTGSLNGAGSITLSIDGQPLPPQRVTLNRDLESTLRWNVPVSSGVHTLAVDNLSLTLQR